MTRTFRPLRPLLLFAPVVLGGAFLAEAGGAATTFDGIWAVQIVASNGNCPARTIPIAVENGRISYSAFGATAEGAIATDGALQVSFAQADEVVNASGAVDNGGGAGSWNSSQCEGSWTARRG